MNDWVANQHFRQGDSTNNNNKKIINARKNF